MQFFINNQLTTVDNCDPNITVLRYLRTVENKQGTKEGCASGDCGACTVLVGDGKSPPVSVNSCITPLGSLKDKYLYTVDGLADAQTGKLHAVQQAMVDCHGSQCGFCTPGFVMSLTGLYEQMKYSDDGDNTTIDRSTIEDAIAGNLCRCTGYRPIIDAGQFMLAYDASLPLSQARSQTTVAEALPSKLVRDSQTPVLQQGDNRYFLPESESELQALLKKYPQATLICGGTDLSLELTQRYRQFKTIIDVTRVEELNRIDIDDTYLTIGASASYSKVEEIMSEYSPAFLALLHRLGSKQIRHRGSIGGNLANGSPIADTPPIFLAWDAEIEVVSSDNQRRYVPIDEFYLGYRQTVLQQGDYIATIRVARTHIERPHRFFKLSKRFEDDISAVMGAFSLSFATNDQAEKVIDDIRIAYGGMAATPVRVKSAESLLRGKTLADRHIELICAEVKAALSPMTDVRATASYRNNMAANLLRRALLELRDNITIDVFSHSSTAITGGQINA